MFSHRYITVGVSVFVGLVVLWIGGSTFRYFTYSATPEVRLVGMVRGGSYKGKVACSLEAQNGYKVYSTEFFVDDKPVNIEQTKYIKSKEFKIPFELDTTPLAEGKHVLKMISVDSSYHANKSIDQFEFFVDNKPLQVSFEKSDYKVSQGRTLHIKLQTNKPGVAAKINLFSTDFTCCPESNDSVTYEAFIPVDCEQSSGPLVMQAEAVDKVGNTVKLSCGVVVNKVNFPRQRGFYVPAEKLNDEKEVSMDNKILNDALQKWLSNSPKQKMWSGAFEMPTVVKKISTPFGEVRVTAEKGRYLHKAIDIVNDPKSVIWASQNGKVIIKDRYLMSGNTVIIDHGLGVFTKYFHLDEFANIEVGEMVKKGSPVGKLGMTGYSNGYHLHWELSVNGVSVDPVEWTKFVF
jgi:murein DD-endopeptidase MepM/ murein hydrolase activator NlpD